MNGAIRVRADMPTPLSAAQTEPAPPCAPISLTPRERHVLALIGQGMKSSDVAEVLGVSKRTVDFHLDNVYAKLGVRHRMAAICEAARRGIPLEDPRETP